jgi:hypothetical protein
MGASNRTWRAAPNGSVIGLDRDGHELTLTFPRTHRSEAAAIAAALDQYGRPPLTELQQQVLDVARDYQVDNSVAASVSYLMDAVGKSRPTVHAVLQKLIDLGYADRPEGSPPGPVRILLPEGASR